MTLSPGPATAEHWGGGQATPRAHCILAPNPGPMTLDGTNTWVLLEPGSTEALVIDPGPLDEGHLQRVLEHVAGRGARVVQTILTHGHVDHAESAARFAELTGAPTRAVGRGHDDLGDGDVLRAGGLEVRVVATPGHTADSISFALPADHALLTGDTVLGRGTTVIMHPEGSLGAYLRSLRVLAELPAGQPVLPGHGPDLPDGAGTAREYLAHREERLDQIRRALATLGDDATPRRVVELVYADVDRSLWWAAEVSVGAQLAYLRGEDTAGASSAM